MAPENKKAAGNAVQAETSKQSTPKTKTPKPLKPEPKITKKLLSKSKAKEESKPEPKITQSSNTKEQLKPKITQSSNTKEQLKPKPKITKKLPKQSSNTKEQLKPEPKITKKLPNQSSNTEEELTPEPKITKKLPNQSSNTKEQVKPEPKITKKLPNQSNDKEESKRPQSTQGSGATNKEDSSGKKGSDNAQVKDRTDDRNQEKIDGIIFMCNANTKADCFHYMVMGLPGGKRELVATIKPGLKLFLFDFDAKLLYGIFKAASAGGWRLEPAAFNGSYPAQVRFEVDKDCLPLPEATFKKAITGNSGGDRIKFNTELTGKQVKILTNLFEPCHKVASNVNPSILIPQAIPVPRVPLRPDVLVRGPNGLNDPSRRNDAAPVKGEDVNPLAFGEKEYRMFGLKKPSAIFEPVPAPAYAVGREAYYPYSLPLTRGTGYCPTDLSRGIAGESEYRRPEQLTAQPAPYPSYPYSRGESEVEYARREAESSRSHSSHAAAALSDYNRVHQELGSEGDYGSLPVSSRYSFAGPSFSHR